MMITMDKLKIITHELYTYISQHGDMIVDSSKLFKSKNVQKQYIKLRVKKPVNDYRENVKEMKVIYYSTTTI